MSAYLVCGTTENGLVPMTIMFSRTGAFLLLDSTSRAEVASASRAIHGDKSREALSISVYEFDGASGKMFLLESRRFA